MSDQNQPWGQNPQQPQAPADPNAAMHNPYQPSANPEQPEYAPQQPMQSAPSANDPYPAQSAMSANDPWAAQYQQNPYEAQQYAQGGFNNGVPGYTGVPAAQPSAFNVSAFKKQSEGFFLSLFDFKFETFIAPKIVAFNFIISIAVVVIVSLMVIANAFSLAPSIGFLALLIVPILGLLSIIFARLTLEATVAIFRIATNSKRIADKLDEN